MSEPFLGEIRFFSFNFPPKGWALCEGQLMPINQNQALFSLLGTTYGGDGRVTFALPDLRDRAPAHMGDGFVLGERGGEATHTLTQSEMPAHAHTMSSRGTATSSSPANAMPAVATQPAYGATPNAVMSPATVANAGGSQPHPNMPPYLVLAFGIAISGIFPSQN
jgi:microcystin-dependent protein